jgi:hypothetical protein
VRVTDAPASYRPDYTYPGLPDRLPRPPEPAQKTASPPVPRGTGRRRYVRYGVQLIAAAGAGFGLVATVITVAGIGPARSSPPSAAPARTLLTLEGSGARKTEPFTTGTDWTVRYAFDCSQIGGPSTFVIREDAGAKPIRYRLVDIVAEKQSGVVPRHDAPGPRYLEITTSCAWSVTITG